MIPLQREQIKYKSLGSLMGVFIGDAMGLPAECKSPVEIQHYFGYIDKYVSNRMHKYSNVSKRSAGTISDDSQLTLALMHSFKRSEGYDLADMRRAHVEAYEGQWGEPVGWGGSTRLACQNIKNNVIPSAAPGGSGNGPTIKIAPLAIYSVYKTLSTSIARFTNSFNASLLKKCHEITTITHPDIRCVVACYCQSRMIIRALQNEIPKTSERIAALFAEDAEYAEDKFQVTWPEDGRLSDRIKQIVTVDSLNRTTNKVSVDICTEKSSYIMNSYPFVVYCVSKYIPYHNFLYAITETINAGADADSNGSMVGAIMGGLLGLHAVPPSFIRGLKKHQMLIKQAKEFEQSL